MWHSWGPDQTGRVGGQAAGVSCRHSLACVSRQVSAQHHAVQIVRRGLRTHRKVVSGMKLQCSDSHSINLRKKGPNGKRLMSLHLAHLSLEMLTVRVLAPTALRSGLTGSGWAVVWLVTAPLFLLKSVVAWTAAPITALVTLTCVKASSESVTVGGPKPTHTPSPEEGGCSLHSWGKHKLLHCLLTTHRNKKLK